MLTLQLGILWGFVLGWVHSHPHISIETPSLSYSLHHYHPPTATYSASSYHSLLDSYILMKIQYLNLVFIICGDALQWPFCEHFSAHLYILVVHENPGTSTSPSPLPYSPTPTHLPPYHPIICCNTLYTHITFPLPLPLFFLSVLELSFTMLTH